MARKKGLANFGGKRAAPFKKGGGRRKLKKAGATRAKR